MALKPDLTLILRPHIERGGYHTDRFDAYLGDELICVSRQPLYDGARALLDLGYHPDTPLTIRHADKDPSFEPRSITELAQWTITERDRAGLSRERWRSYHDQDASSSFAVASPASEEP
jgi:hypothetical protein